MSFSALATTPCAMTLGSVGLRLPRFFPLGQPPSLALRLAARALALDVELPSREPMLISFPQCGHFMPKTITQQIAMNHAKSQSSPLPRNES